MHLIEVFGREELTKVLGRRLDEPIFVAALLFRTPRRTVAGLGNRIHDKETESPYLVHPLTYRQVYRIKEACFTVKISSVLLKCLKIALLT